MILVDIGNTRIKWRSTRDQVVEACVYDPTDIEVALASRWEALTPPSRVVVSSVAEEVVQHQLTALCQRLWGVKPAVLVSEKECCGVTNGYRQPAQLGVDRWMAVIAAYDRCRSAVIVIDAGSAVTIDVVDAAGIHLGGLILPGLAMMTKAFFAETANKPQNRARTESFSPYADNTGDAIGNGSLFSVIGAIQLAVAKVHALLPADSITVMFTGGDAEALLRWIEIDSIYEPNLVLDGVALAADSGR